MDVPHEFLLVWFQKATYDSGYRLTKLQGCLEKSLK